MTLSRFEIVETEAEYKAALREIERCGEWVSFDSETSGLNRIESRWRDSSDTTNDTKTGQMVQSIWRKSA